MIDYFRLVVARARRNAWSVAIEHSWMAVLKKAIGLAIAFFVLLQFKQLTLIDEKSLISGELSMVIATSVAAITLFIAVFLLQLLFIVPYELWRDAVAAREATEARIKETRDRHDQPIKDRTSVTSALLYTIFGEWGRLVTDLTEHDQINLLSSRRDQFQQLAHDGSLRVWGRLHRDLGVHTIIDPAVWTEQQIEWFSMIEGDARTQQFSGTGRQSEFFSLLVSKSEIECLFMKSMK